MEYFQYKVINCGKTSWSRKQYFVEKSPEDENLEKNTEHLPKQNNQYNMELLGNFP